MSFKETLTGMSERFKALPNASKVLIGVFAGLVVSIAGVAIALVVLAPTIGGTDQEPTSIVEGPITPDDAGRESGDPNDSATGGTQTEPDAAQNTAGGSSTGAKDAKPNNPGSKKNTTTPGNSGTSTTPSGGNDSSDSKPSKGSGGVVGSASKISPAQRSAIAKEMIEVEKRAEREAEKKYPGPNNYAMYLKYYTELYDKYKAEIVAKYKISYADLDEIIAYETYN